MFQFEKRGKYFPTFSAKIVSCLYMYVHSDLPEHLLKMADIL